MKPIKVFYSELSKRFYASQHYKQKGDHVVITGRKYDVTQDIAQAVVHYDLEFTPIEEKSAAPVTPDEPKE